MEKPEKSIKIEISHRTIIFTFVFFLFLKFLWMIKDLLFSFLIAFIIMSALKPAVIFLTKKKIPRVIASIIVYFIAVGLFIYGLAFIIPPLFKESLQLLLTVPLVIENFWPNLTVLNFSTLTSYLPDITSQVLNFIRNIFSNTLFVISTLFFGFYFLVEENFIKDVLTKFFEVKKAQVINDVFNRIEKRMSNWFWGETILMLLVGLLNFIGFSLVGIKYALPLAVLAGLLEVIPNLGPTVAAVPALLIGLSQSAFMGLAALAVAFLVQQLENNMIVPLVMRKVTGLNPIFILTALIIGGKIGGVPGVILAIPLSLILETLLVEISRQSKLSG
jgi:predicted PurR-regulated permease PerM